MDATTEKTRIERDLAELEALLLRAEIESQGDPDDEIAQRLLRQLIEKRRLELACRC